jgi:hypothetical protein
MGSKWGIVQQWFLMRHTSSWMMLLINKMCDCGHKRIHVWFTENYSVGRHLKSWTARANFLWRDSEQWQLFTVSMLCNTFMPHLLATGLPLQTQWFMQDGVRPHTENVVLEFLNDTFDSHVISNRFPDHFACGQKCGPWTVLITHVTTFFGDSLRKRFFWESCKQ